MDREEYLQAAVEHIPGCDITEVHEEVNAGTKQEKMTADWQFILKK